MFLKKDKVSEVVRKMNTFIEGPLKVEVQKILENSEIFDLSDMISTDDKFCSKKNLKKIIDNILLGGDLSKQGNKKIERPHNLKYLISDMISLMGDYQIITNNIFLKFMNSED